MFATRWLSSLNHRLFLNSKAAARTRRGARSGFARRDVVSSLVEVLEDRALLSASAVTSEALVNVTTTGVQQLEVGGGQSVAAARDGSYVVVWDSDVGDGSGWGIRGRQFNADGTANGTGFAVNSTTTNDQQRATVAVAEDGQFVVVWQSRLQDGAGWGIFAQRFGPAGSTIGGEFRVNQTTAGDQTLAAVTFLQNGTVAVAWRGQGPGDGAGVFARIFDASGNPTINEVRVNGTVANDQTNPSIASDGTGGFVVAWSGNGAGDADGIFFRHFSSTGAGLIGETRVNQTTAGVQSTPNIVRLNDGTFALAWTSNSAANGNDVRARRINANGAPLTNEIVVNQTLGGTQQKASVAATTSGFAVAWEGSGSGDASGVFVRQFNFGGNGLTTGERVNQTVDSDQISASVAGTGAGFVVTWNGRGPGDGAGVFVRQYEEPRFIVNTTADSVDVNPGDGIVADSLGRRSLRAAIMEANALAGTQVIVLSAGTYAFTRAGVNENGAAFGDLDITGDLRIQGAGANTIIGGANLDRVFEIFSAATVTIQGVRIQGGAASLGAGIANHGRLNLRNSTINNNTATQYGGGLFSDDGWVRIESTTFTANKSAKGGGIANLDGSEVTLRNSNLSGNSATSQGGGLINEFSALSLIDSFVTNNTSADDGGGAFNSSGVIHVSRTTFTGNNAGSAADDTGGGIESTGGATEAIVNIVNSAFTNNNAFEGGGVMNRLNSTVNVNGSTFTSNTAKFAGGGISNTQNARVNVVGSTFKTNKALGGSGTPFGGGGIASRGGTVDITNTLFQQNTALASAADVAAERFGFGGGIIAVQNATVYITNGQFLSNSADVGGGLHHSVGFGPGEAPTNVEIVSSTFTTNSARGHGGAIDSQLSTLKVANSTFTDNTAAEDGGAIRNVASIVSIERSTFTGNDAGVSGGAIQNLSGVPGIISRMTVADSTFTGNTAQEFGGGIDNSGNSILEISRSTLDHNRAEISGGGIANTGEEVDFGGIVHIFNTTISGNTAGQSGGGVYNDRNFTSLTNATVAFNSAPTGGGIFNEVDSTPANPTIAVDGDFTDWASLPNFTDPTDDQHDTDHDGPTDTPAYVNHPDVDLLSYKVAHDDENLYFYFESRGVIGRTQTANPDTGARAGRYYVIVTADVDNDNATGYPLHEGGYYPTTTGYDMNAELEFFNGAINTGHYLQHGAKNEAELQQAFADQSNGQYVWGGPDTQGPFDPGFVNVTPGTYANYTQWVYKENDAANAGQDSLTFVKDQGPAVPGGNIQYALSADGHKLEMIVPYKGFLSDADGNSIVTLGKTLDLSFSLEASGELSNSVTPTNPNGRWASDTANPINGYFLGATSAGVQLENTIVTGNTGATDSNVSGDFDSLGHNLIGLVGAATGFDAPGDQVGVNAATVLSATLGNNGGPTKTHALLAGSAAIDAGNNGAFMSTVDQRGLPRIVNGQGSEVIDIGAFEAQPGSLAATSPSKGSNSQLDALFADPKALDKVLA